MLVFAGTFVGAVEVSVSFLDEGFFAIFAYFSLLGGRGYLASGKRGISDLRCFRMRGVGLHGLILSLVHNLGFFFFFRALFLTFGIGGGTPFVDRRNTA